MRGIRFSARLPFVLVYFDMCALQRPHDDQSQVRVRLEAPLRVVSPLELTSERARTQKGVLPDAIRDTVGCTSNA